MIMYQLKESLHIKTAITTWVVCINTREMGTDNTTIIMVLLTKVNGTIIKNCDTFTILFL